MMSAPVLVERVWDGRIPVGYQVWLIAKVAYEGREGTRILSRHPHMDGAVQECRDDLEARGTRTFRVLAPPQDPSLEGHCSKCNCKENLEPPLAVTWRCHVCKQLVCRECTLTLAYTAQYFELTLCSRACWENADRPEE